MPWRGPEEPGEFPTLGYQVIDFIEASCAIPDGNHRGDPYMLTEEMQRYLLWFYRLKPDARPDLDAPSAAFVYFRGGQLVQPQKWGKGPFSAACICAEAEGPVVFDGWDAAGEPVGRPWSTPLVQVTAVSEDQADNVWLALVPMIELGSIGGDIPDTGETRINLRGGGKIEPVTSSARSRLGQRVTFVVQDETHSWTRENGGRKLAQTQRRNLAGMGGRFMETTNAWDPAEESVAQKTWEGKAPGVYKQMSEAGPGSVRNKADRTRMLKRVYGDSFWVDRARIDAEIVALLEDGEAAQAERFFLNRIHSGEALAFDLDRWKSLTNAAHVVPDQALVVLGVDGARWDDALAVIATEVATGHQWPVGIWEQPENAAEDYEHPFDAVDGAVAEAFERFDIWRMYIDPQYIEHLVDRWQGRWTDKRVVKWWTNRPKQMAHAVRRYRAAQTVGELSHDGDSTFTRHIGQAHRQKVNIYDEDRRQMWVIAKDRPHSPRKMDGAAAGALAWECRGDAIAANATATKKRHILAGF